MWYITTLKGRTEVIAVIWSQTAGLITRPVSDQISPVLALVLEPPVVVWVLKMYQTVGVSHVVFARDCSRDFDTINHKYATPTTCMSYVYDIHAWHTCMPCNNRIRLTRKIVRRRADPPPNEAHQPKSTTYSEIEMLFWANHWIHLDRKSVV